jgi:ribosomal protein S18 acetylase RimI-like enzyme
VLIIIRPSRSGDGPSLQRIERLADERFREVGLDGVADDEPPTVDALAEYASRGRSWVAVDEADQPVGYVIVEVVDGAAHIEQISVGRQHQGAGVGRALIDCVRAWASETGRSAITLTTFTDVAWNGPLYRHLGFAVMAELEIGSQLRAVRDAESARGLDPAMRICMRLDIER